MLYEAEKAKRGRRQVGKGVMAGRMRDDAAADHVEYLHNIDDCSWQSAFYEQPHNMRDCECIRGVRIA
jgi:hypothetical protein